MTAGDLEQLLDEEAQRIETFRSEVRDKMQTLLRDIDHDLQQFFDLAARDPSNSVGSTSIEGMDDAIFSHDTSDIFIGTFGSVLSSAITGFSRTGTINPRALFGAGGRSIGTFLGRAIVSSSRAAPEKMRLSRSQTATAILRETSRSQRND